MKKLLLLLLLILTMTRFADAQNRWEIGLDSTSWNTLKPKLTDTVYFGQDVYINYVVQNFGTYAGLTNTFPGGTYTFNCDLQYATPDFPKKKVAFTQTVQLGSAPFNGYTSTVSKTAIHIDNTRFKVGVKNIIIIWPNGGKASSGKDSMDTINQRHINLYLWVKDKSGIKDLPAPTHYKTYPNPAKDVVNIEMVGAGKGTINLSDISGKLIATKPFETTAGGLVSIPLKEGAGIPDGIYLISVETATYKEVSKIVIGK